MKVVLLDKFPSALTGECFKQLMSVFPFTQFHCYPIGERVRVWIEVLLVSISITKICIGRSLDNIASCFFAWVQAGHTLENTNLRTKIQQQIKTYSQWLAASNRCSGSLESGYFKRLGKMY